LAVAKAKMPTAAFFEVDMADFDLQRRYDVIREGPGTDRFALIGDLAVTRTAFTRIARRFWSFLELGSESMGRLTPTRDRGVRS
jgi:hypothetical protein